MKQSIRCTNEDFLAYVREAHRRMQPATEAERERQEAFLREHPEANALLIDADGSLHPLKFVPIA